MRVRMMSIPCHNSSLACKHTQSTPLNCIFTSTYALSHFSDPGQGNLVHKAFLLSLLLLDAALTAVVVHGQDRILLIFGVMGR